MTPGFTVSPTKGRTEGVCVRVRGGGVFQWKTDSTAYPPVLSLLNLTLRADFGQAQILFSSTAKGQCPPDAVFALEMLPTSSTCCW